MIVLVCGSLRTVSSNSMYMAGGGAQAAKQRPTRARTHGPRRPS